MSCRDLEDGQLWTLDVFCHYKTDMYNSDDRRLEDRESAGGRLGGCTFHTHTYFIVYCCRHLRAALQLTAKIASSGSWSLKGTEDGDRNDSRLTTSPASTTRSPSLISSYSEQKTGPSAVGVAHSKRQKFQSNTPKPVFRPFTNFGRLPQ
ncbi:hypothetical protein H2248_007399 [Termitomyces sp. 'cryptogamus']|nr:hypothetical protein H2248_007399 [Termitomyces sp. 'cryptogamus']